MRHAAPSTSYRPTHETAEKILRTPCKRIKRLPPRHARICWDLVQPLLVLLFDVKRVVRFALCAKRKFTALFRPDEKGEFQTVFSGDLLTRAKQDTNLP